MTTHAEIRQAERELSFITTEKMGLGFMIEFARRIPENSEDLIRIFLRAVGATDQDIDRKVDAVYTLANQPRPVK